MVSPIAISVAPTCLLCFLQASPLQRRGGLTVHRGRPPCTGHRSSRLELATFAKPRTVPAGCLNLLSLTLPSKQNKTNPQRLRRESCRLLSTTHPGNPPGTEPTPCGVLLLLSRAMVSGSRHPPSFSLGEGRDTPGCPLLCQPASPTYSVC